MDYSLKNFSIITTGGCNADCSFCTGKHSEKASPDYRENLDIAFKALPKGWDQVSITGGEPTISPDFNYILERVKYYKDKGVINKCVLTTNGTKLKDKFEKIIGVVNHINISRHGVGDPNNIKIFSNKQIINDSDIKYIVDKGFEYGIDVTLNCVITKDNPLTEQSMYDFIEYSRSLGCSVAFRFDQFDNSLAQHPMEFLIEQRGFIPTYKSSCPVCRSVGYTLFGVNVQFKYSVLEPSNNKQADDKLILTEPYELIYHPSAKLTVDWAGTKEYMVDLYGELVPSLEYYHPKNKQYFKMVETQVKRIKSQLEKEASLKYVPRQSYGGCGGGSGFGCGR